MQREFTSLVREICGSIPWQNHALDPLDKELERRGLRFARDADDFLVLVNSLRAAQRVIESISRFLEGRF